MFDYVPFVFLAPILAELSSSNKVTSREWTDLYIPVMALVHLLLQDTYIGNINLTVCLSMYYIYELSNRKDLSMSIKLHHGLTLILIFFSLCINFGWWDNSIKTANLTCMRSLLYCETSTIFLNLRPVLQKLSFSNDVKNINTYLFIASFIWFRYTPSYYILSNYPFMIPRLLYVVFLILNTYWIVKYIGKKMKGVIFNPSRYHWK